MRAAAHLTRAEVHPFTADFHALVALPVLRVLDGRDGSEVRAGSFRAHAVLSSSARFQAARLAAASYVLCRNSNSVSRGDAAVRTSSYMRMYSPMSWRYEAAAGRTGAVWKPGGSGAAYA